MISQSFDFILRNNMKLEGWGDREMRFCEELGEEKDYDQNILYEKS